MPSASCSSQREKTSPAAVTAITGNGLSTQGTQPARQIAWTPGRQQRPAERYDMEREFRAGTDQGASQRAAGQAPQEAGLAAADHQVGDVTIPCQIEHGGDQVAGGPDFHRGAELARHVERRQTVLHAVLAFEMQGDPRGAQRIG